MQDLENIKKSYGEIGRKTTKRDRVITWIFILAVIACFVLAHITRGFFRTLSLEIGLLLLSIKIGIMFHNEIRINHIKFWILTSIEERLELLISEVRELKRMMKDEDSSG
ncbi:hypothetical protein DRQ16_00865 [bacterium]|nr:MAG: hypothetical protein DRQ18_00480 [bacterium]RKZ23863.1 MAG: hypothetical protein DRQ16_00865 [bacterium]RKZ26358.1 MAG: hypothetical protein DRQ20_03145 [bacterium]